MTTLTRASLVAATILGVAAIGPMLNRHSGVSSAQGQAPTPVSIASPLPVPVSMPAFIDHGRIPYQAFVNNEGLCSGTTCTFTVGIVPTNHRVVVERISGLVQFAATPTFVDIQLNNLSADLSYSAAPNLRTSIFNEAVQGYFDSNQTVRVFVSTAGTTFDTGATVAQVVTVSGYELDCSAAACSPIATH